MAHFSKFLDKSYSLTEKQTIFGAKNSNLVHWLAAKNEEFIVLVVLNRDDQNLDTWWRNGEREEYINLIVEPNSIQTVVIKQ